MSSKSTGPHRGREGQAPFSENLFITTFKESLGTTRNPKSQHTSFIKVHHFLSLSIKIALLFTFIPPPPQSCPIIDPSLFKLQKAELKHGFFHNLPNSQLLKFPLLATENDDHMELMLMLLVKRLTLLNY